MRRLRGRGGAIAALALAFSALAPQAASATFHETFVREVYAGSDAQPNSDYVELQMWASGQNLVGGHTITVFGPTGAEVAGATFPAEVPNGVNQATIVAATPEAESQFGIKADVQLQLKPSSTIERAGGAACWETLDCVSWGNFSATALSPTGSPAAPGGIPSGMALRRSIARSCATLLEASDDSDNSAGDFEVAFPNPRPNAIPPTEKPCTDGEGGGQGGRGGKRGGPGPQTTLKGPKPAKKTHDRTPTFRFTSPEDGATFQCRVDGGRFRTCRSPFTTKKLSFGRHTFKVRARDRSGEVDPTPAAYRFQVLS
jgi:hypothetical protein